MCERGDFRRVRASSKSCFDDGRSWSGDPSVDAEALVPDILRAVLDRPAGHLRDIVLRNGFRHVADADSVRQSVLLYDVSGYE